jgi:hypothetical protein
MYDTKTYASLPPWQALVDPSENVRHHFFLADVVEQVVVMALVEFERFVGGTGIVVINLSCMVVVSPTCQQTSGSKLLSKLLIRGAFDRLRTAVRRTFTWEAGIRGGGLLPEQSLLAYTLRSPPRPYLAP